MEFFGKSGKAKEEHKIAGYKEEINLAIAEEITERKTEVKEEEMIDSLDGKIRNKEWVGKTSKESEEALLEKYLIVESKEGYEFIIEVDNQKQTAKVVAESKTQGQKYHITYHPNGGSGEIKTVEVKRGFYKILDANTYTKTDYVFKGWCEIPEPDESSKIYLEGDKYQPKEDVTLYAIWKQKPITAETIKANPSNFYGSVVTGYSAGTGVSTWRIYYADSNNIYLIADNNIAKNDAPNSPSGKTVVIKDSNNSRLSLSEICKDTVYSTGSAWISSNSMAKKWLSKYLAQNPKSTNQNIKAVAYLMDTNIWSKYVDNNLAEYAIGTPTL